jgi:hypothetical protein
MQLARNSADSLAFRGANAVKSNPAIGGAVAQLGARLDGIEEVRGSNPLGSTKFTRCSSFTFSKTNRVAVITSARQKVFPTGSINF